MARKSLSERIAERAQRKQKKGRGGPNRAAFLAIRGEIAKALDDGWPIKEVWETLVEEGAIKFGYDAFLGYVKKLIQAPAPKAERAAQAAPERDTTVRSGQPPVRAPQPPLPARPAAPTPQPSTPSRSPAPIPENEPQRIATNHKSSFEFSAVPKKKRDPDRSS